MSWLEIYREALYYERPTCLKCGALPLRRPFKEWQMNWADLSINTNDTCPNCGGVFDPKPIRHRLMHYLFQKFKRYPVSFLLFPLLGLVVGFFFIAMGLDLLPLELHSTHFSIFHSLEKFYGLTVGIIILSSYSWVILWFLLKCLRRRWTAFCDLMLHKFRVD